MPQGPSDFTDEINLEPVHLIEKSRAIIRFGKMLLAAGTGSFRVRQATQRVAAGLGVERMELSVSATEIIATFIHGGIFRTRVAGVQGIGVNADRIVELETLSRHTDPGTSLQWFEGELDRIAARRTGYPFWILVLAAVMACTGFAFLNNGGWVECLSVGSAMAVAQSLRYFLLRIRLNQLAVVGVCAAIAALFYLGMATILAQLWGLPLGQHAAGFTSALLLFIPGFPLITGALDLARLDLQAGISRLTYGGLVIVAAGLGGWVVSLMFSLDPQAAPAPGWPFWALLLARIAAGFAGVLGFALLFNTPLRVALGAAAIGSLSNGLRLSVIGIGWMPALATFCAALLVGLLAARLSTWVHAARITLTVPSILIMIPGTMIYRALVSLSNGSVTTAVSSGFEGLFVIGGIAVGLTVARMLTERQWSFDGLHRSES